MDKAERNRRISELKNQWIVNPEWQTEKTPIDWEPRALELLEEMPWPFLERNIRGRWSCSWDRDTGIFSRADTLRAAICEAYIQWKK